MERIDHKRLKELIEMGEPLDGTSEVVAALRELLASRQSQERMKKALENSQEALDALDVEENYQAVRDFNYVVLSEASGKCDCNENEYCMICHPSAFRAALAGEKE